MTRLSLLLLACTAYLMQLGQSFESSRVGNNKQKRRLRLCASDEQLAVDDRLKQLLEKMNHVMQPAFFESDPVLKQMHVRMKKQVLVQESSIPDAGSGLFAKQNLKAGTIVSFYPAHALGMDSDSSFTSSLPTDASYFSENPSTRSSYLHCTDQPIFGRTSGIGDEGDALYLDVNPNREVMPTWVSQLINDGAVISSNTEQGVLDYFKNSGSRKNCIHIPFGPSPLLATVTTKKVKKGQELLTSYGATYWLGVWLDVHGEEGVAITPAIQAEIQSTAKDLVGSMKSSKTVYSRQLESLQSSFMNIQE